MAEKERARTDNGDRGPTRDELYEEARALDITGRSDMTKAKLESAIEDSAQNEGLSGAVQAAEDLPARVGVSPNQFFLATLGALVLWALGIVAITLGVILWTLGLAALSVLAIAFLAFTAPGRSARSRLDGRHRQ